MAVHQLVEARERPDHGVGIVYINKKLELPGHLTLRAIIKRIRKLVAHADFPAPAAPRIVTRKGVTTVFDGAEAVDAHARWNKDQVDAWFDNRTPPKLRLVAANAELTRDRATLDARAASLIAGARA